MAVSPTAVFQHRALAIMAAALLLAPPSLAFGGGFRRTAASHFLRISPSSCRSAVASSSSLLIGESSAALVARRRRPRVTPRPPLHILAVIRGGGGRRHSCLGGSTSSPEYDALLPSSSIPLPASFDGGRREEDAAAAIASVLAACRVTRAVQPESSGGGANAIGTLSKKDASPVTVGDFASQASCLRTLHARFPNDMFIAEEGSEALRGDDELLDKVLMAVNGVRGQGDLISAEQLLRAIDHGRGADQEGSRRDHRPHAATRRVWCLDPIDGTKGFLRGRIDGGQYCIALALIEDGEPVVSVLGCPNLPLPSTPATAAVPYGSWSEEEVQRAEEDPSALLFSTARGCMFVSVRGCGCYEIPLHLLETCASRDSYAEESAWTRLRVTPNDGSSKPPSEAKFCLGVERGFSDPKGTVLKIAQLVHGPDALTEEESGDGVRDIKNSLRMDGQGKYGLLARGDAECFLRLPKDGYIDWVWDVAAGYLILKEAGGAMTDLRGRPVDFSQIGIDGRAKLPDHVEGILGSCGGVFHEALVDAHAKAAQM